ncbi:MAG: indole-3-glycerol phosphate synthase TrpC [Actinomycetota bacterium]|nr:indole-3-glycerol phosphate synthase TrpC [Actinomycetota bacterium]
MSSYLDELVAGAHARLDSARDAEPLDALRERALQVAPGPSLEVALRGPGVAVIAEIKRASPSRGPLAPELDAVAQAEAYRDGGAAAVSVLTEPDRFLGSLDDLAAVARLEIPTLRKDFVVSPYQVWEARAAGASAVLLIVAALGPHDTQRLLQSCREADLDALVEVHNEQEAALAYEAGAAIVGINARDLNTFEVDQTIFARVRPALPDSVVTVAESALSGPEDVRTIALAGADAVLVGESLITAPDPRAAVALLVSAGASPTTATEYR